MNETCSTHCYNEKRVQKFSLKVLRKEANCKTGPRWRSIITLYRKWIGYGDEYWTRVFYWQNFVNTVMHIQHKERAICDELSTP
jgi:hypothetical protein